MTTDGVGGGGGLIPRSYDSCGGLPAISSAAGKSYTSTLNLRVISAICITTREQENATM